MASEMSRRGRDGEGIQRISGHLLPQRRGPEGRRGVRCRGSAHVPGSPILWVYTSIPMGTSERIYSFTVLSYDIRALQKQKF